MAKYRKKPVEVEAVHLTWKTWEQVCEFVGDAISPSRPAWPIPAEQASSTCGEGGTYIAFMVTTAHGEFATVRHGDWIIRDSRPGTFYPCKPDIFDQTYESVDESEAT